MNENNIGNSNLGNNNGNNAEIGVTPVPTKIVEKKGDFNVLREAWEWFYTILLALVIALAIKMFIVDIVRVDGTSMSPTLSHKDRLFITKIGYKPKQGDVIIFDSNYKSRCEYYENYEEDNGVKLNNFNKFFMYLKYHEADPKNPGFKRKYFVKRIIGMPGDVIDIKEDGKVYVNDEVLDEPYLDEDTFTGKPDPRTEFPFTVSEDHVFVIGDNRTPNGSFDSRSTGVGEIPFEAIAGKAVIRLWPITAIKIL